MIFKLPPEKEKAKFYFEKLLEKECTIELKERKPKRTLKQNNLIHALFSLFAIEIGYTLNETKQLVKSECHFMSYRKDGYVFLRSTADLDTKELSDFVTWFRNWSGNKGVYLPTVEEYLKGYLDYEIEIDRHKQYL